MRAYAGGLHTSEVCGSIVSWNAGLTSHGDIAMGSPDDSGPVASMYGNTTATCLFSCNNCEQFWPAGTQIYAVGGVSNEFRIAWGEYGTQTEGWQPWYAGRVYMR